MIVHRARDESPYVRLCHSKTGSRTMIDCSVTCPDCLKIIEQSLPVQAVTDDEPEDDE